MWSHRRISKVECTLRGNVILKNKDRKCVLESQENLRDIESIYNGSPTEAEEKKGKEEKKSMGKKTVFFQFNGIYSIVYGQANWTECTLQ